MAHEANRDPSARPEAAAPNAPLRGAPAAQHVPPDDAQRLGKRAPLRDHPIGFWFIFWGELAERASYYGMRAILALYMVDRLEFKEASASQLMALFGAAVYFLPLAGGYVADHFLGKYRTIVLFSLPYILGHVILGVEQPIYLYAALILLAMGSGVIKPNISPLMGMTYDQQRPGQTRLRSDAFAIFYGAINVGAALSQFAMPILRTAYGYRVAFLFPAALMAVAFAVFALGKPFYAKETIAPPDRSPAHRRAQRAVLERLAGLFVVVSFFWVIFEQSPSTWTFFARDHLRLDLWGRHFEPDQLQALNPILILVMLPVMTLLWRELAARGWPLRPTQKMLVGFVLTAVAMGLMAAAGILAGPGKVSLLWLVAAYVLVTAAEICISVVGLELAYSVAPPTMKSFVTACWLLTVFLGQMMNLFVTPFYDASLTPGAYFGLMTLALVPVTGALYWISRRFERE